MIRLFTIWNRAPVPGKEPTSK